METMSRFRPQRPIAPLSDVPATVRALRPHCSQQAEQLGRGLTNSLCKIYSTFTGGDVYSTERRKALNEVCQPRKFSFSSLRDCSITIAMPYRRKQNRKMQRGTRFPPTNAIVWLRPRGWRSWSWKPTLEWKMTRVAILQNRERRSGDAEPAPNGSAT